MRAGLWWRVVLAVLATMASAPACAPDSGSPSAGATREPTPLSTERLFIDDRERPKVAAALEDFMAAFEARDWEEALSWVNADGRAFLRKLRKVGESGGPAAVDGLGTYGRLAVAVLRTSRGPQAVGKASLPELLEMMADTMLLGRFGRLDLEFKPRDIQPLGDRAFLRVLISRKTGASFDINFALEDDRWKVDVADFTSLVDDAFAALAEKRGVTVRRAVLDTASTIAGETVTAAVWEKPAVDA